MTTPRPPGPLPPPPMASSQPWSRMQLCLLPPPASNFHALSCPARSAISDVWMSLPYARTPDRRDLVGHLLRAWAASREHERQGWAFGVLAARPTAERAADWCPPVNPEVDAQLLLSLFVELMAATGHRALFVEGVARYARLARTPEEVAHAALLLHCVPFGLPAAATSHILKSCPTLSVALCDRCHLLRPAGRPAGCSRVAVTAVLPLCFDIEGAREVFPGMTCGGGDATDEDGGSVASSVSEGEVSDVPMAPQMDLATIQQLLGTLSQATAKPTLAEARAREEARWAAVRTDASFDPASLVADTGEGEHRCAPCRARFASGSRLEAHKDADFKRAIMGRRLPHDTSHRAFYPDARTAFLAAALEDRLVTVRTAFGDEVQMVQAGDVVTTVGVAALQERHEREARVEQLSAPGTPRACGICDNRLEVAWCDETQRWVLVGACAYEGDRVAHRACVQATLRAT